MSYTGNASNIGSSMEPIVKEEPTAAEAVVQDSDGIPPGVDLTLWGQKKTIKFYGHFYATPEIPFSEIYRKVQIIFASKEIYVAMDLQHKNLYVVDRSSGVSLGCRMNTELLDYNYRPPVPGIQLISYGQSPGFRHGM
jgi:hypothetical protein